MAHDNNEIKVVESKVYDLDPEFIPVRMYLVHTPSELMDDVDAASFRDAIEMIMGSDLREKIEDAYRDVLEGKWDDEAFEEFVERYAFEIAEENGWRIFKVIRDGRKLK